MIAKKIANSYKRSLYRDLLLLLLLDLQILVEKGNFLNDLNELGSIFDC